VHTVSGRRYHPDLPRQKAGGLPRHVKGSSFQPDPFGVPDGEPVKGEAAEGVAGQAADLKVSNRARREAICDRLDQGKGRRGTKEEG
jgi:hypothetical protein